MYFCAPHMCLVPMETKRGYWVLRTRVEMVVSCHMVAGTQTPVLWKNNQFSLTTEPSLQSLISCPSPPYFPSNLWSPRLSLPGASLQLCWHRVLSSAQFLLFVLLRWPLKCCHLSCFFFLGFCFLFAVWLMSSLEGFTYYFSSLLVTWLLSHSSHFSDTFESFLFYIHPQHLLYSLSSLSLVI